jgi:hypothetical protein
MEQTLMEQYAQMDGEVKEISSNQTKHKITFTPRSLQDMVKGSGFTFNQSIAEFIDNSLDAGSTKIQIIARRQKNDYFSIEIKDNGRGMSDDILEKFTQIGYGNPENYSTTQISNYGLGAKFALINICKEGPIVIESVSNGNKIRLNFYTDTQVPYVSIQNKEATNEANYTKLYIPNLEVNGAKISKNQLDSLKKFIGATYFPHIDRGNKLHIKFFIDNEEININFTDPIYRNLTALDGVEKNDASCMIDGYLISVRGRWFNKMLFSTDNFNLHDSKQGGTGFAAARSGIYWRLNGRYIKMGDGDFMSRDSFQQKLNHLRIEVDLDRIFIQTFGIGFNKSKISIDRNNEKLKDFFVLINDIIIWAEKKYMDQNKQNTSQDPEITEERDNINRDLSAIRRQIGHENYNELLPELPKAKVSTEKEKTDKTKNRPDGLQYKKSNVQFRYVNNGKFDRAFGYGKENGQLVVDLNLDHPFVENYIKADRSSKKAFDMMLLSFIEGLIDTRREFNSDVDFANWEDYMVDNFSRRMSRYFTHY